ncbi:Long-chain-fatty-acid--CoA ligase, putative [Perkinsus marinus ATCC 50983]|uniref:Long-chain-fatty-acid--CoA ligase, putative n=1 Tax=Perkinsus marinus (strain ATCC 50983 / TXsc) TaxID=423536 RepID=C5LAH5_PERM5|nr:Long-chain-fatty-acid--CoA ligase, putative [Perkinsus marinus ATCC 50983]EER06431.1 Long-chain-fatty-acid--CoA ligase, putative [Perkinsus marinus ATCC 50983]|eukprot:XP_002774615.1 Long-chain-fatty-acid--CoA ligase, putative [Perkinsus marinus ATCC 50983]
MDSPSSPYTYEVPNTAIPGVSGPIYRHPQFADRLLSRLQGDEALATSFDVFRDAAEKYADQPCHGTRPRLDDGSVGPYEWQTYKEVYDRILNFGRGLEHLNLLSKSGDGSMRVIGIYMKNRSEWIIAEQGAFTRRATTVPLYDTLGEDAVSYVINQTQVRTVVCSSTEVSSLLQCKDTCPSLECIICLDPPQALYKTCEEAHVQLVDFCHVEACGAEVSYEPLVGEGSDVGTFCYTSGTTGAPKGALLSQAGMLANVAGLTELVTSDSPLLKFGADKEEEAYLSYLPLAHVMERLVQTMMYHFGAAVGFSRGDPRKIMEDVAALRPTLFVCVPRILNRLYDGVIGTVRKAGGMKESLFYQAVEDKKAGLRKGLLKHDHWDAMIFDDMKRKLGLDRARFVATGSAPVASHVLTFMRVLLGCPVVEGYGQTEATCAVSYAHIDDFTVGHVGLPIGCLEVKLMDVGSMGYLSTDTIHACKGRGEICYRGPSTFLGYYNMPEKTRETIDSDGWVHSGDIGIWLTSGQLKIIDRKKSIFKLSQGEYIAPDKIENVVTQSPLVAQAFVYGNSFQSRLVAVVVPDFERLLEHFPSTADGIENTKALCESDAVRILVLRSIQEFSDKNKLRGFEKVKAVHLSPVPFTAENGLLTPSFKLKRDVALKTFQKDIDMLYENIGDKMAVAPRTEQ